MIAGLVSGLVPVSASVQPQPDFPLWIKNPQGKIGLCAERTI